MGAKRSAKYLFLGSMVSKLVTFAGSIFLARILFPEDFGYLLVATIVTGFIQIFGNVGFETFYLQEHTKSEKEDELILNITFKLRLLVNGMLFFLQIAVSYVAEYYYDSRVIGEMIRIFALSIPINALSQINMYILRKKLNYKPEVFANLGRDVVGTVIKVFLAFSGLGALSFAIGGVVGNLVRYFIFLKFQNFKPVWTLWNNDIYRKIFHFGKHSFVGGIGMFFTNQIDKILLSSFFNANTMGNYYFANSQAQTVFAYLIAPQRSLVISYSAKHKNKSIYLFNILSSIGYLLAIILLPVTIFLTLYAHDLIPLVFGEKWNDSIYMFQLFLVYYFLTELTFPFSGIITAYGLPEIGAKLVWSRFIVLLVTLGAILIFDPNIYSYLYGFLAVSFLFSWIKIYIAAKIMHCSLFKYLVKLKNVVLLTILYLFVIWIVDYIAIGYVRLLLSFIIFILLSFAFHLTLYKEKFVSSLELFLGKNHRILQRIK